MVDLNQRKRPLDNLRNPSFGLWMKFDGHPLLHDFGFVHARVYWRLKGRAGRAISYAKRNVKTKSPPAFGRTLYPFPKNII